MLSFLRRRPPLQDDEDATALRKLRDDDASGATALADLTNDKGERAIDGRK